MVSEEPIAANTRSINVRIDRGLEVLVVFVVVTSLIGLAAALAGKFLAPQVLIASLIGTGLHAWKTRGRTSFPGPVPRVFHLALLLIVALFFRLPAYNYVLGGQDEGIYVNMAQTIARTGGVQVRDDVARQLAGSAYLQRYLQDNRSRTRFGIDYVPGVYARNPDSSELQFQFYRLFPVWMALFAGLFGAAFGVYALTFFALLSVLFFYRLALLLTRSHRAALAAGGLLALNPLHVFFSKFPVTEVPTLAFSLMGFTLLAGYWSAPPGDRQGRWLVLSVLSFLCLFTTRISGFMYVPFFIALALAALILDADAPRRRAIQAWTIGIVMVYLISVIHGLTWVRTYSLDIYPMSFAPMLGVQWERELATLAVCGLVLWAVLAGVTRRPQLRLAVRVRRPLDWLPGITVFVALALGLLKIFWLGWTTHYANDPWLGELWGLANSGWQAAAASSLWALVVYLGPLLVLAFFALIARRQTDPRLNFLRWFVAGFFAYVALLQWTIPYGPYFARYLLSELAPYLILLVVCIWAAWPRRTLGRVLLSTTVVLSLIYAGVLSAAQIGQRDQAGLYETLARLVAPVQRDDLILLDAEPGGLQYPDALKTPLLYTFGRKVVSVDEAALENADYLAALDAPYDDLFLVTPRMQAPSSFDFVDEIRYKVVAFPPSHFVPLRVAVAQDVPLYVFKRSGQKHESPKSYRSAR